ncbi:hypothetical protein LTR36_004130 [Oleoguttula mirabilis]|uniref:Uncharacterized protein n=1 Tax=Oleoguttula mirabilis TaxID=1507867 RepID=A0AAV9JHF6_9PEZI|nr:hypothetical protein LTR36_004130 [Oleoguttula mirabilis]
MSETDDIDGVPMSISPIDTPLPASSPEAAATSPAADAATSDMVSKDTAPSSPAPLKATPKKRGAKAKKEEDDGDDADETPKKKAKSTPAKDRQRKTPTKAVANARAIARSYEECSEWDKKLIDMRDAGRAWADIRVEWEKLTGDKTASSTLPNRFMRLKANFTVIKEEDNKKLIEAKIEVEQTFERGKWTMIASAVEKLGGDTYKPDVLQRQYKKLMLSADAAPPAGVQDKDFDVKLDEEE